MKLSYIFPTVKIEIIKKGKRELESFPGRLRGWSLESGDGLTGGQLDKNSMILKLSQSKLILSNKKARFRSFGSPLC